MKRILKFFRSRVLYPVLNLVIFETGWWGYLYLARNRHLEQIYRDIVRRAAAAGFQFRVPHIRVVDPRFWDIADGLAARPDAVKYVRFERRRGAPCLLSEVIIVEASAVSQLTHDFLGAKIALAHVLGTALMAQRLEVPPQSFLRFQIDAHGPDFPNYFAALLFMEFFLACLKETALKVSSASTTEIRIQGYPLLPDHSNPKGVE